MTRSGALVSSNDSITFDQTVGTTVRSAITQTGHHGSALFDQVDANDRTSFTLTTGVTANTPAHFAVYLGSSTNYILSLDPHNHSALLSGSTF